MSEYSFTRSQYDKCNVEKRDQESRGPFNWIMDPVYESKEACYQAQAPFIVSNVKGISRANIDIESDLRNQTRILSKCPSSRFNPTTQDYCKNCKNCDTGLPCDCTHCRDKRYENELKDCTKNLASQYTRVKKPCNIFSGMNINRFHPLCDDLQDANKIQSNSYIGVNTRLQIRDKTPTPIKK